MAASSDDIDDLFGPLGFVGFIDCVDDHRWNLNQISGDIGDLSGSEDDLWRLWSPTKQHKRLGDFEFVSTDEIAYLSDEEYEYFDESPHSSRRYFAKYL